MRLALILVFLLLPAASRAGESELIDRVVAVVTPVAAGGRAERGTVITLSELELEARIALIRAGGAEAAAGPLDPDTLTATLDHLIAEHLLLAEAEELAVVMVNAEDVKMALEAFQDRFASTVDYEAFLARWELPESELKRILRRGLVVDRYVVSRARLSVSVSDAELRQAWQRAGGAPEGFDAAREGLRETLEKSKRAELVSALVADLRSRAQVRVLHDLGGRRQGGPAK